VRTQTTAGERERPRVMKSTIIKRSIVINGHKTSISIEDQFWAALKSIAAERKLTLSQLVSMVDDNRESGNLSSAVRVFVLSQYRRQKVPEDSLEKPAKP